MIRTETEYRESLRRVSQARDRLTTFERKLHAEGWGADEVARAVAPSVALISQQEGEVQKYERMSKGDLSDFTELCDVGQLLTAGRIACGRSQRELGKALEVHESQVSRDERREYQGISLDRACDILEALGIRVQLRASIAGAEVKTGPEPRPPVRFKHRAGSAVEASFTHRISLETGALNRNRARFCTRVA